MVAKKLNSPSGRLMTPSGARAVIEPGPDVWFNGSISLPIAILDGEFETIIKSFSGGVTLALPIGSGDYKTGSTQYSGGITLPSYSGTFDLNSENSTLTTATGNNLIFKRRAMFGRFKTLKRFSGNVNIPILTGSGSFEALFKSFSGGVTIPLQNISGKITKPVKGFKGAIRVPLIVATGTTNETPKNFSGGVIIPTVQGRGRKNGIEEGIIVIENFDTTDGNWNTQIQGLLTRLGIDSFDNPSRLTGIPYGSNASSFSITLRRPELENREALEINPRRKKYMSGDIRSYVDSPVAFKISLTWRLLRCNDELRDSLLGLLLFKNIRYVIEDTTYEMTLLDDVYRVVMASRGYDTLTLNFRGRKVNG